MIYIHPPWQVSSNMSINLCCIRLSVARKSAWVAASDPTLYRLWMDAISPYISLSLYISPLSVSLSISLSISLSLTLSLSLYISLSFSLPLSLTLSLPVSLSLCIYSHWLYHMSLSISLSLSLSPLIVDSLSLSLSLSLMKQDLLYSIKEKMDFPPRSRDYSAFILLNIILRYFDCWLEHKYNICGSFRILSAVRDAQLRTIREWRCLYFFTNRNTSNITWICHAWDYWSDFCRYMAMSMFPMSLPNRLLACLPLQMLQVSHKTASTMLCFHFLLLVVEQVYSCSPNFTRPISLPHYL